MRRRPVFAVVVLALPLLGVRRRGRPRVIVPPVAVAVNVIKMLAVDADAIPDADGSDLGTINRTPS